jgi:hypothetical protein
VWPLKFNKKEKIMSIIDPGNPIGDSVALGAQKIKRALLQCTNAMEQQCTTVRNLITTHTRSAIDDELGPHGTNTSVTTDKLVDSGATFVTDSVQVGDAVRNDTDGTTTTVSAVDSETQLALDADIFTAGSKAYYVGDAAELVTLYKDVEIVLESAAVGKTIPSLPS